MPFTPHPHPYRNHDSFENEKTNDYYFNLCRNYHGTVRVNQMTRFWDGPLETGGVRIGTYKTSNFDLHLSVLFSLFTSKNI